MVTTFKSQSGKIILILSYKVITVYVRFIFIYIRGSKFKSPLYRLLCFLINSSIILMFLIYKSFYLQNYFNNLLKIIFDILESLESNKTKSGIGSNKVRSKIRRFKSRKIYYKFIGGFWESKRLLHFFISARVYKI